MQMTSDIVSMNRTSMIQLDANRSRTETRHVNVKRVDPEYSF